MTQIETMNHINIIEDWLKLLISIEILENDYFKGNNREKINLLTKKNNLIKNKYQIYFRTTEMLGSIYDKFLDNIFQKSIIAPASSGEEGISALVRGANNIILYDINPLAYYFSFTKIWSYLNYSHKVFLNTYYSSQMDAPDYSKFEEHIVDILKFLPNELNLFWSEMINRDLMKYFDRFVYFEYTNLSIIRNFIEKIDLSMTEKQKLKNKKIIFYNMDIFRLPTTSIKTDYCDSSNIGTFVDNENDWINLIRNIKNSNLKDNGVVSFLHSTLSKNYEEFEKNPIQNLLEDTSSLNITSDLQYIYSLRK